MVIMRYGRLSLILITKSKFYLSYIICDNSKHIALSLMHHSPFNIQNGDRRSLIKMMEKLRKATLYMASRMPSKLRRRIAGSTTFPMVCAQQLVAHIQNASTCALDMFPDDQYSLSIFWPIVVQSKTKNTRILQSFTYLLYFEHFDSLCIVMHIITIIQKECMGIIMCKLWSANILNIYCNC